MGTPIQHTYSDSLGRYIGFAFFKEKVKLDLIPLKGVIKKKIVQLYADELNSYQVEQDVMLKIKAKIKCTFAQSVVIKKHPKVVEMEKAGYKHATEIVTQKVIEEQPLVKTISKPFMSLLAENVNKSSNPRLAGVCQVIFKK